MEYKKLMVDLGTIQTRLGFLPGPDGRVFLPPPMEEIPDGFEIKIETLASEAGFLPPGGKLNLPVHQGVIERFAQAAIDLIESNQAQSVVLTGAGPAWLYLGICHELHGRIPKLSYAAPNAKISLWNHLTPPVKRELHTGDKVRGMVMDDLKKEGENLDVTITGAAPVWAFLVAADAIHRFANRLNYKAPNAQLTIFSHGIQD